MFETILASSLAVAYMLENLGPCTPVPARYYDLYTRWGEVTLPYYSLLEPSDEGWCFSRFKEVEDDQQEDIYALEPADIRIHRRAKCSAGCTSEDKGIVFLQDGKIFATDETFYKKGAEWCCRNLRATYDLTSIP